MKISEQGHVTNVALFEKLVESVNGCGSSYNPVRAEIKLTSLQQYLQEAQQTVTAVHAALSDQSLAIARKKSLLEKMNPLLTRIAFAVRSIIIDASLREQVTMAVRKARGNRVRSFETPAENPAGENAEHRHVSASHTGIISRIDGFERLITLLEGLTDYAPNEPDLSIGALRDYVTELKSTVTDLNVKQIALLHARSQRDKVLYGPVLGLIALSMSVKSYVASVFGLNHPVTKKLRAIQLRSF